MVIISKASVTRIVEVLEEEIDIKDQEEMKSVIQVEDGSISFQNVSFSYTKREDKLNLEKINSN